MSLSFKVDDKTINRLGVGVIDYFVALHGGGDSELHTLRWLLP